MSKAGAESFSKEGYHPINSEENVSSQISAGRMKKQNAMDRMRLSIKDTLFKGVSRKVNQTQEEPCQLEKGDQSKKDLPQMSVVTEQEHFPHLEIKVDHRLKEWQSIVHHVEQGESTNAEKDSHRKIMPTQVFEEIYEYIEDSKLGEGCHGDVRKCRRKRDQQVFAVKIIRNGDTEIILSAITSFQIAQKLNHHSVIKPQELFINRETEKICYVMEYCDFPSLQSYIEDIWGYPTTNVDQTSRNSLSSKSQKKKSKKKSIQSIQEVAIPNIVSSKSKIAQPDISRRIIKEILKGVAYLHAEGICHRDLKPDNILVSVDQRQVKIIDFEISKKFKFHRPNRTILKVSEMWTRTGTQDFMGPEMFESTGYNESVDVWAVGVITYLLLTGKLPFDQEYISDKIESIREARYNMEYLSQVDDISKDFIRRMLKKNPRERLTAIEALSHPWFLMSEEIEQKKKLDNLSRSTVLHPFQIGKANSNKLIKENPVRKDKLDSEIDDDDEEIEPCSELNQIKQTNSMLLLSNKNQIFKSKFAAENPTNNTEHDSIFDELREQNLISESEFVYKAKSKQSEVQFSEFDQQSEQNGCESELPLKKKNYGRMPSLKRGYTQKIQDDELNPFEEELAQFGVLVEDKQKTDEIIKKQNDQSEEFKKRIQTFKEQMSDGMTNLKFIHINQKERVHPKASQLRLKLLSEKNEKENQSSKIIQANVVVSEFQMQGGNQTPQSFGMDSNHKFHIEQQFNQSKILLSSGGSRNDEHAQRKQGEEFNQYDIIEMREKGSKSISSALSPKTPFDKNDDALIRLRSSTNQKMNSPEEKIEDQNEHRAKRLSEDFTSSCVMSTLQNQTGVQVKKISQLNSGLSEFQGEGSSKKKAPSFWLFQQQNEECDESMQNMKNQGGNIGSTELQFFEGMRNSNEKQTFFSRFSGSESPSLDEVQIRFRRVTSSAQQESSDKSGSISDVPSLLSSDKLQDSAKFCFNLQNKED